MKILDYLYYKLYRANLIGSGKDIAEYAAAILLSGLVFVNLFVIGSFLRKIDLLPLFFKSENQVIIFIILLIAASHLFFLYKSRFKKIISKYENETEAQRKKGNLIVWIYVLISFLSIFVVALYKPGKL